MKAAYPDEKEIYASDKWQTQFLWKETTGVRVQVGQYYCNLVFPSAMTRSIYIKNGVIDWMKGDISKLRDHPLYTNKITNIKAFTIFWNWMNGACEYIPPVTETDKDGYLVIPDDINVIDMIDIIDYMCFFKCASFVNFPIIEHFIDNLSLYLSDLLNSEIYYYDKIKYIYGQRDKILDFYHSAVSNVSAGNSSMIEAYNTFSHIGICSYSDSDKGDCESKVYVEGGNYRYCKEHSKEDKDIIKDDKSKML